MHARESPPTLIVGMHRSGTSLLTELLQPLGLFVGWRLDSHHESTFHQRINRRLTSEAGGHWSRPEVVAQMLEDKPPADLAEPLRPYLVGAPSIEYWGRRFRERRNPTSAWGWKDPRNGYLLPLWRSIYPDLRVVWIRRDPRETAESLYRRALQIRSTIDLDTASTGLRPTLRRARATYQGHPILADAWRAMTAEGCLDIALAYERVHRRLLGEGGPNVLAIEYRQLLSEPLATLAACADLIELRHPAAVAQDLADLIRPPALDRTAPTWQAVERAATDRSTELSEFGYP